MTDPFFSGTAKLVRDTPLLDAEHGERRRDTTDRAWLPVSRTSSRMDEVISARTPLDETETECDRDVRA
jgi:hypothetical protein